MDDVRRHLGFNFNLRRHDEGTPLPLRWALVACSIPLAGCGGTAPLKVFPVHGSVEVDGKPAANAFLIFHPQDATDPRMESVRPTARSDDHGSFAVWTQDLEGAPAGSYVVTAIWNPRVDGAQGDDPESSFQAADALQGAYATPAASDLRVTVAAGPNRLEPFRLTTKNARRPGA